MAIDGCYGGAAHDSFVWGLSEERRKLLNAWQVGKVNSWLLGIHFKLLYHDFCVFNYII